MSKSKDTSPVEGWTEARYWVFIRSLLRKGWSKYPPKFEALKRARKSAKKGQKHKWEYQCSKCNKWFLQREVQVDHIEPAGTLKNYSDLPAFCKKLFCSVEDLTILCKPCHAIKTGMERSGLSEEDVIRAKWVIEKMKQRVSEQRWELSLAGYTADQVSNLTKRKSCYEELARKTNIGL